MASTTLPTIEPPAADSLPIASWQHASQSGQFRVKIDLIRRIGRRNAIPAITLAYQTGRANGLFGLGWSLSIPVIVRGNGRYLPRYRDSGPDTDVYS